MPIVTMGFNAERFQGRNLALRLVALGYTNVYWYRGGREAWEVAGAGDRTRRAGLVGQLWALKRCPACRSHGRERHGRRA